MLFPKISREERINSNITNKTVIKNAFHGIFSITYLISLKSFDTIKLPPKQLKL